jgi:hypothetical protein
MEGRSPDAAPLSASSFATFPFSPCSPEASPSSAISSAARGRSLEDLWAIAGAGGAGPSGSTPTGSPPAPFASLKTLCPRGGGTNRRLWGNSVQIDDHKHTPIIQTLRQLCDDVGLDSDGRRYALVARLNQHRDYRAWTKLVGPGIPSAAELKNAKKHSIQNLRQRCAEFGMDSDGSRYVVVARLNQHRDWNNRCAQIQQRRREYLRRRLRCRRREISGNGFPTTTVMTTTPASDFAEKGDEYDADAVSDDDEDPD